MHVPSVMKGPLGGLISEKPKLNELIEYHILYATICSLKYLFVSAFGISWKYQVCQYNW